MRFSFCNTLFSTSYYLERSLGLLKGALSMPNEEITQESNPSIWEKLHAIWIGEEKPGGRPGYVLLGSTTYNVIQKVDGSIAFVGYTAENLYDSTSF